VTHPPGRKVCVHCGGRVQTSRDAAPALDPLATRLRLPGPAGEEQDLEDAAEPESRGARGARIGMTLVWVVLAAVATLLRLCQEQG
jgi:hypothetical protein